jgi:predicted lipoprotein with Yx(FWY)xxD motif
MKSSLKTGLGIAMLLTGISFLGCKHNVSTPSTPAPTIQLASSPSLGNYLTDKDGRTLYFFSNDANGLSTCQGGCEAVWPIFNADNLTADKLGAGLSISDFKNITSASGKPQLAYKGWPLYYYAPSTNGTNTPEAAGQTLGEAVGGVWFVAKPDYTIMLANAQLVGNDGKSYKSDYTEGTGKTIYFVDGSGATLYSFSRDKNNTNVYTKPDFSNNAAWPIYETDQVVAPSVLDKTLFGSITVFGKKQLTYKGWPLYHFGADGGAMGSNKGVSVPTPGAWPAVTKNAPAAPL